MGESGAGAGQRAGRGGAGGLTRYSASDTLLFVSYPLAKSEQISGGRREGRDVRMIENARRDAMCDVRRRIEQTYDINFFEDFAELANGERLAESAQRKVRRRRS